MGSEIYNNFLHYYIIIFSLEHQMYVIVNLLKVNQKISKMNYLENTKI